MKNQSAALDVLNILGYQVFEAANGSQAIQEAKVFNKPIHLLLTDVLMPKMNGRDLANKIKSLHPEISILFMSGYNDDIISNHGILEENVNFLAKPFTPQMLADKIRYSAGQVSFFDESQSILAEQKLSVG